MVPSKLATVHFSKNLSSGPKGNPVIPLCLGLLFFCHIVWLYTEVMPLPPRSGDDWTYFSQFRDLFPSLTRWNPARIFPEVLQPLMGWLASILYSFTGNYVEAAVQSHALFMAFFTTSLCVVIYICLADMLNERSMALFLTLAFAVCSFCLLKSRPHDNLFLFHTYCITASAFYVFPAVLNCALALYVIHGQFTGKDILAGNTLTKGFFALGVFLAQFSMTCASAIACGHAVSTLLLRLWRQPKKKLSAKMRSFVQSLTTFDGMLLTIVVFWILAAALDMLGGRYGRVRLNEWHFDMALAAFGQLWAQLNIAFVIVAALVCSGCLARFIWKFMTSGWQTDDSRMLEIFCITLVAILMMSVLLHSYPRTPQQC
ncbi:MAG: hypothetical protein LBN96_08885 [Desulfovibrio sp.]|jgi:hypothetical protein|nr:hypothetical protein [Desulfovibrio sp.]